MAAVHFSNTDQSDMTPPAPQEALLTFKEAMTWLHVSRSTIYRLMESGQMTGRKVGSTWRFYGSDLRACVQVATRSQEEERRTCAS